MKLAKSKFLKNNSEDKVKKYIVLILLLLTGSILMQSFQCASRNLTTAKVKYQNKDYAEAEKYLRLELQQFPNNDEAKILLTEVLLSQNKVDEVIKHLKDISGTLKDPKMISQYNTLTNRLWVGAYNEGIVYYNKYANTQKTVYLDTAIQNFDLGLAVKPELVDFHTLKGMMLDMEGDTAKAIKEYEAYINKLQGEIDFAYNNGITIGMTTADVEKALGKAVKSNGYRLGSGDSVLVQFFNKSGEEIFHYQGKPNEDLKLVGWRVNLPNTWAEQEKQNLFKFDISPLVNISQYYYNNGDKEASLKEIKKVADLDPANEQVNAFVINLYQELNKTDEAIASVESLTKKEPNNEVYWTKFGDLYTRIAYNSKEFSNEQKLEYFKKAVEKYDQALKLNPTYDFALRNAASANKNIAGVLQTIEDEKADKDETYEHNKEVYEPYLKKSGELFARALDSEKWKNDYLVVYDLINIYLVLENQNEVKQVLRRMEALEYSITNDSEKLDYYYKLIGIYGDLKESDKMKEVQKKIEDLTK